MTDHVLFVKGCGYIGYDEPAKGPVGGWEYYKGINHPNVMRFATEKNAKFSVTFSGAVPFMKKLYEDGILTVEAIAR